MSISDKYESIYRILISFMLADKKIHEWEKKAILDFLKTKYWVNILPDAMKLSAQKDRISVDHFKKDVKNVSDNFKKEDLLEIIGYIKDVIKADGIIDTNEVKLFENLLLSWGIDHSEMQALGIKKSFWFSFF